VASAAPRGDSVKEKPKEDLQPIAVLATESLTVSINVKHIECSLCLSAFDDPRMLPCGHTFCLQCIVRQIASSSNKTSFPCSMCRQVCTLPDGGDAAKLPKNYSLAAVLSQATKDTSSASAAAAAVNVKLLCKKHTDQKIAVYCRDCKVLACAVCGLVSHSKHTCIEVDDADKEFKKKINAAAEKCKKTIATRSRMITDYEEKLRQEQAQLAADKLQLAQYEGLLDGSVSSVIEREAAVKTL
jgi:tripartite motif-containing protein 2/3